MKRVLFLLLMSNLFFTACIMNRDIHMEADKPGELVRMGIFFSFGITMSTQGERVKPSHIRNR
jgi:hypothetical protein